MSKQELPTPNELYVRHGDTYLDNLQKYYAKSVCEPKDYCWTNVRNEMLFIMKMYFLTNVIVADQNTHIAALQRAIKEAAAMGEITTCYTCTRNIVDDEICDECDRIGTHWRFDYERFSREETE